MPKLEPQKKKTPEDLVRENIATYRKKAEMTQEALGKQVKRTQTQISQYETGFRSPSKKTLAKIADILQKPISAFYEDHAVTTETSDEEQIRESYDLIKKGLGRLENLTPKKRK